MERLMYKIDIEAYPYQRPRFSKNGNHVHNTTKYELYKNNVCSKILNLQIPPKPYEYLRLHFYFPYPSSTSQKKKIDLAPRKGKYDVDNLIKAFMDALQKSGVIPNDSCICGVYAEKIFSVEKNGWIEFELE